MIGKSTSPQGLVITSTREMHASLRELLLPAPSELAIDQHPLAWQFLVNGQCECQSDSDCQPLASIDPCFELATLALPAILMVDWKLPASTISSLMNHAALTRRAVIALVGEHDAAAAIDAHRRGASDILLWPVSRQSLQASLARVASGITVTSPAMELADRLRYETAGHMIGGISHEVHQPLYAIANFAGAAINTLRTSPVQDSAPKLIRWCEQIAAQSHRAAEILQRLRRFASIDTTISQVSLPVLMDETIELITALFRDVGVQFERKYDPSLPELLTYRAQVQQVLLSLLEKTCHAIRTLPLDDRNVKVVIAREGANVRCVFSTAATWPAETAAGASSPALGSLTSADWCESSLIKLICETLAHSLGGSIVEPLNPESATSQEVAFVLPIAAASTMLAAGSLPSAVSPSKAGSGKSTLSSVASATIR